MAREISINDNLCFLKAPDHRIRAGKATLKRQLQRAFTVKLSPLSLYVGAASVAWGHRAARIAPASYLARRKQKSTRRAKPARWLRRSSPDQGHNQTSVAARCLWLCPRRSQSFRHLPFRAGDRRWPCSFRLPWPQAQPIPSPPVQG